MTNEYNKVKEFDIKIESLLNDRNQTVYSLGFYKEEYSNPDIVWTTIQKIHNLDGNGQEEVVKTLRHWAGQLERLASKLE